LLQQAAQMRKRVEELSLRLATLRQAGSNPTIQEELRDIIQELRQIGRDYPQTAVPFN